MPSSIGLVVKSVLPGDLDHSHGSDYKTHDFQIPIQISSARVFPASRAEPERIAVHALVHRVEMLEQISVRQPVETKRCFNLRHIDSP